MAIKTLFGSFRGPLVPATETVNYEGVPAYEMSPKQALAQYAATGCFGRTFYVTGQEQLSRVLELCEGTGPEFTAKVAIHAREHSYMKDMPAQLRRHWRLLGFRRIPRSDVFALSLTLKQRSIDTVMQAYWCRAQGKKPDGP